MPSSSSTGGARSSTGGARSSTGGAQPASSSTGENAIDSSSTGASETIIVADLSSVTYYIFNNRTDVHTREYQLWSTSSGSGSTTPSTSNSSSSASASSSTGVAAGGGGSVPSLAASSLPLYSLRLSLGSDAVLSICGEAFVEATTQSSSTAGAITLPSSTAPASVLSSTAAAVSSNTGGA